MMTRDDWESLQSSPGWRSLKTFLWDWRKRQADLLADGMVAELDMTIARCKILKELFNLQYETIANFYGNEQPETE